MYKMYKLYKRQLNNLNLKYKNGELTAEEYEVEWEDLIGKLDVLFTCNRITDAQYKELMALKQETAA